MQKVCKMPDPMLKCRSKVSVKTERYICMHVCTKTHTHKGDKMHMKGQRKTDYSKKQLLAAERNMMHNTDV